MTPTQNDESRVADDSTPARKEATGRPWTFRDVSGAGLQIYGEVSECVGVNLPKGMPPEVSIYHLTDPAVICVATERWVQFEPQGWAKMQQANAALIVEAVNALEPNERRIEELTEALNTILANTEADAIPHIGHDGLTAYQSLAKDISDCARATLEGAKA